MQLHAFFISNTFISNVRLKLTKNQENQANLGCFKILQILQTHYYRKIRGHILKISKKDYTVNHNKNEDENKKRSHKYNIVIPRSRHGYKYSKCKKWLSIMRQKLYILSNT